MASTSVHFQPELLERLNRLAKETGLSRNRLIVQACESLLAQAGGEWPQEFFSNEHLSAEELQELAEDAERMIEDIWAARRSRERTPF